MVLEHAVQLTEEYDMLPAGAVILCAVSGGADSMCLLHWLAQRARETGLSLYAAHFDHQIRGTESAADAEFVRSWCEQNGIPLTLGTADVPAQARLRGQGLEETARVLRYDFLRKTAAELGADRIATAHNADDNAETLLLHLVRGTGLQGLTGIPPRRGGLIRPLLTTPRTEILSYLSFFALPHREDSSNRDESYARNKLRNRVIPVLKELNPRFAETCAAAVRSLRLDNDYLSEQVTLVDQAARWMGDDLVIDAKLMADLPPALAPRAARRLLELMGYSATDFRAAHFNGIADLCRGADPSAVLFLPHGLMARRVYCDLLLTARADTQMPLEETPLCFDGVTEPNNSKYRCLCRPAVCPPVPEPGVFYLRRDALDQDAVLRPRRTGDTLKLAGRAGTSSIKKRLIDAKIPRREREQLPLLCDSRGVAALAGFGPAADRVAAPGQDSWAISFQPINKQRED